MKFSVFKNIVLASMMVSTVLVTGCSQTVSDDDNKLLNSEHISEQLTMLNVQPTFKQTAIDEIKYVTTFSSWTEAAETLGLDLAPCANDNHLVNYNVLPNYSILQTDYGMVNGTFDDDQLNDILDFDVVGWTLNDSQSNGFIQPENGMVGFMPNSENRNNSDQSYGVESVTVFLPNSKNIPYQSVDPTTKAVKLSDRVSVDADTLYKYFNDFLSIGSGSLPDFQWEYIKTVHVDRLGIDVDFCTTPVASFGDVDPGATNLTQLFAFMIYDDCLFEVSYGILDGDNIQDVVNSINV